MFGCAAQTETNFRGLGGILIIGSYGTYYACGANAICTAPCNIGSVICIALSRNTKRLKSELKYKKNISIHHWSVTFDKKYYYTRKCSRLLHTIGTKMRSSKNMGSFVPNFHCWISLWLQNLLQRYKFENKVSERRVQLGKIKTVSASQNWNRERGRTRCRGFLFEDMIHHTLCIAHVGVSHCLRWTTHIHRWDTRVRTGWQPQLIASFTTSCTFMERVRMIPTDTPCHNASIQQQIPTDINYTLSHCQYSTAETPMDTHKFIPKPW